MTEPRDPRETLRLILETLFFAQFDDLNAVAAAIAAGADPEETLRNAYNGVELSEAEIYQRLHREHGLTTEEIQAGYAAMETDVSWDENGNPIGPPLQ